MNKNLSSEIFNAFKAGDQNAYKLILKDLFECVVLYSFKIVKDQMEAEDIFIEAFQKLASKATEMNDYGHFRAELYTVVRNRSINYYNRQKDRMLPIDEISVPELSEESVEIWMMHSDVIRTLREVFNRLETADQLIAEYLIFKQRSPKEAALLLGMNEQTVRNKRAYLYKLFKKALIKKGLPIFILF